VTDCHEYWHYDRANYVHSTYALSDTLQPVVGIATDYGLKDRGVWVRVPVGSRILIHVVQTGSGAHPASQAMGTGGGGKTAEA
jgi:hypothetical protein